MAFDLTMVGGKRLSQAAPDGGETWDFGCRFMPRNVAMAQQTFEEAAPHLANTWDGKTSISLIAFEKKVDKGKYGGIGEFMPAQNQPRGTCVGRGASKALNVLQCVQIALGKRATFKPVSHAFCYGLAREKDRITGNDDGAVGASALQALNKIGMATQEEAKDPSYTNDDVAVRYGAGRGGIWVPQDIKDEGSDNLVNEVAPASTAQGLADAHANGATATIASDQGFTMTRDSEGFCRPQGSWAHQMCSLGVVVTVSGRKGFIVCQSWGDNTPDGPTLWESPDYCFGVEWNVMDRMLKQRDSMIAYALQGWEAQPEIVDHIWW